MSDEELKRHAVASGFRQDSLGLYHPQNPDIHSLGPMLMEFGKRIVNAHAESIIVACQLEAVTPADVRRIALESKRAL